MILLSPSKLLSLHLIEPLHSANLFNLTNNSRQTLRTWLSWIDGTKEEKDVSVYIEYCLGQISLGKGLQLIIFKEKEMVGSIGLYDINRHDRKANLNYWLGEDFRGEGIISKSCHAFINYSFNDLGLNRLEIRCASNNLKSQAIPKRLGFIKEGTLRSCEWINDRFVDHIVYGMLREEWGDNGISCVI